MSTVQEIERVALALPAAQRACLAETLFNSLDESETDLKLSQEWVKEIEKRCREIDSGEVKVIPGEQVLRGARALIKSKRRQK